MSTSSIPKPLALGVDPKIKAKIWAQEYIDLGHLLNKKIPNVRFQAVENDIGGMSLEKQPPPTFRFESIARWLSAFHIFVNVYVGKFPNKAGTLMKYAHAIKTLDKRSCDVAAFIYERTCREWREYDWDKLPWDHINTELYSEALSLSLKVKFDSVSKGTSYKQPLLTNGAPTKSSKKWTYCFSYNNNGKCEREAASTYRMSVKNVGDAQQ